MKNIFFSFMIGSLATPAFCQEFNIGPTISEMNNLSERLFEADFSKADYIEILDSGCVVLKHAVEDAYIPKFQTLMQETDWNVEEVQIFAQTEQFVEIEVAIFAVAGASEQTIFLLRNGLEESQQEVSVSFLFNEASAEQTTKELQNRVCEIHTASLESASGASGEAEDTPATERESSTARSVAKGVVGVGAIVLDGLWIKGSAGLGSAIGGIASGGWGWNRIEESYFELLGN